MKPELAHPLLGTVELSITITYQQQICDRNPTFFHKHTKLAIMPLIPTLYSHICSFRHYLDLNVLANVKLDYKLVKDTNIRVADIIGFYHF